MALPGNEEEFVVLFFDDQMDINDWVGAVLRAKSPSCKFNWFRQFSLVRPSTSRNRYQSVGMLDAGEPCKKQQMIDFVETALTLHSQWALLCHGIGGVPEASVS